MKRCSTPAEELLAEYIVFATFGLVAPARERIQMEIEAHYAEGVSRRLGEGLPQEQAEIAAAQELGDPHAAARQYRRRHLTEEEASWLRQFEGHPRLRWPMRTIRWIALGLGTVSILLTLLGVSLVEPGDRERVIAFFLAFWLGAAVYIGVAVRSWHWRARLASGPQLWHKVLGFSLIQFQLGCFYCPAQLLFQFWLLRLLPNELAAELSAGVLLLSVLPVFFSKRFRLWRKLRFKQIEAASTLA
jgi:hypothetical protein